MLWTLKVIQPPPTDTQFDQGSNCDYKAKLFAPIIVDLSKTLKKYLNKTPKAYLGPTMQTWLWIYNLLMLLLNDTAYPIIAHNVSWVCFILFLISYNNEVEV